MTEERMFPPSPKTLATIERIRKRLNDIRKYQNAETQNDEHTEIQDSRISVATLFGKRDSRNDGTDT